MDPQTGRGEPPIPPTFLPVTALPTSGDLFLWEQHYEPSVNEVGGISAAAFKKRSKIKVLVDAHFDVLYRHQMRVSWSSHAVVLLHLQKKADEFSSQMKKKTEKETTELLADMEAENARRREWNAKAKEEFETRHKALQEKLRQKALKEEEVKSRRRRRRINEDILEQQGNEDEASADFYGGNQVEDYDPSYEGGGASDPLSGVDSASGSGGIDSGTGYDFGEVEVEGDPLSGRDSDSPERNAVKRDAKEAWDLEGFGDEKDESRGAEIFKRKGEGKGSAAEEVPGYDEL